MMPSLSRAALAVTIALHDVQAQSVAPPLLSPLVDDLGSMSNSIKIAPNGLVFFASDDGIRCYDPARRTSFVLDSAAATDLAVSPRGDQLAFARGDSMLAIWTVRIDPSSGRPRSAPRRLSVRWGRAPAFSPDGRSVAFSVLPSSDTLVGPRIVRLSASGGPEQVVARQAGFAQNLNWSPDGLWIFYRHGMMTPSGQLRTLRRVAATGGVAEALTRIGEFVGLSPDGRRLAYITNIHFHRDPGPKHVVIADMRARTVNTFDLPRDAMPIAWSTQADRLLLTRPAGRSVRQVHAGDLNGAVRNLTPDGVAERLFAVLPDDKVLVLQERDDRQVLIAVDPRSGRRQIAFRTPPNGDPLWLGGYFVGVMEPDSVLRIVDLRDRREHRVSHRDCPMALPGVPSDTTVLCIRSAIGRREIVAVNLLTGEVSSRRMLAVSEPQRPVLQRARDDMIVVSGGGRVTIAPASDGRPRTLYAVVGEEEMPNNDIDVSPDGDWIAFFTKMKKSATRADVLHIVSVTTGAVRSLPIAESVVTARPISSPLWDPRKRFVAVGVETGLRDDVWIIPLNGDPAVSLTRAEPRGANGFLLSADGNTLYYNTAAPLSASGISLWTADLSALRTGPAR